MGYLWGTFYSQIVYLWHTFYSQILSVRYFLFTDTLSVNNFFLIYLFVIVIKLLWVRRRLVRIASPYSSSLFHWDIYFQKWPNIKIKIPVILIWLGEGEFRGQEVLYILLWSISWTLCLLYALSHRSTRNWVIQPGYHVEANVLTVSVLFKAYRSKLIIHKIIYIKRDI